MPLLLPLVHCRHTLCTFHFVVCYLLLLLNFPLALLCACRHSRCGPCQKIAPRYAELAKVNAERALFVKIDVDELEEVAESCSVSAMPTFLVFADGKQVGMVQGAKEAELEQMISAAVA